MSDNFSVSDRKKSRTKGGTLCRDSLPDGRTIPTTITFVEKSRVLVNAFVESCELTKPPGNDVQTELRAEHVRGRYLYGVVVNDISDPASDPIPKIVRFISRETAILKNSSIADIQLQPQPAVVLPAIRDGGAR